MGDEANTTIKERLGKLQAKQRRAERIRTFTIAGTVLLGVGSVVAAGTVMIRNELSRTSLDAVQTVAISSRNHTTEAVTYPQSPPIGGDHDPAWQNCGIYSEQPRGENVVHALEHGAVWITYRPGLPQADIDRLRELVSSRDYVVLSPFAGQDSPVVASAWGSQLTFATLDDPRLPAFLNAYIQGPGTPEQGAACTGGVGEPVL
ncbi:membrane protein [Microtetraspora sp. NBRC 13810]|uniref:DUF3105 domain-containing protein n=1 Tax=Microtetraspora sp. NBRC 13810 TaxID=3030990 RepID=UPI0024A173E5|nr:DUF3105 domain-containing protein [Microtetraspora sp. NBRC 13810]GLW11589.1 membrane protein [Microtetraspora sp. NBRC 13810]